MQKIPLSLARTGMTLARDVFRGDSPVGIPVCARGTELTDALIVRFKSMAVKTVHVEGHSVREEGERSLDDLLADLDFRFSKTTQSPHNTLLHKIYREHLLKSMGEHDDRPAE